MAVSTTSSSLESQEGRDYEGTGMRGCLGWTLALYVYVLSLFMLYIAGI